MKPSARYAKIVEWSEEDQCYVGSAPGLIFGGCYAVRKKLYRQVPGNFLVDDFFINMSVLEQGYACISRPSARVFEEVTGNTMDEFKRKKRISAGRCLKED